ncbi:MULTISPECIES: hypothetical protein [Helicobacter]|uniref:Uncharacterized protein n=1 Tax=Helicobacter mastomyrinus TaxID=287948 RepID=A0ABZ3F420_9HELI|nr:hypothetical protein [uncultured Helicobacter sp.]
MGIIQNAIAGIEKYMKKDRIQKLDKKIKYLYAKKEFLLQKAQKLAKESLWHKNFSSYLKLKLHFVKLALKTSHEQARVMVLERFYERVKF